MAVCRNERMTSLPFYGGAFGRLAFARAPYFVVLTRQLRISIISARRINDCTGPVYFCAHECGGKYIKVEI